MNEMQLDPILVQWLRDGTEVGPEHGLKRALAAVRRVDQRPGWTFTSWWLPARAGASDTRAARALAPSLLLIAMIALLAMALAFAGNVLRTVQPVLQGNLIAYQDDSAIYVARPDGSDRREASAGVAFARLPVFSPDGYRIALVAPASADARSGRLLVVPVDGTSPPVDVSNGIEILESDVPQMSWAPDGTRIAFAARVDGVATILVVASDGSRPPVPITDSSADRDLPTWSPDGSSIGFREKDPDGIRTRLRTTSPDGTNVEEITLVIAADAYLSKPRWIAGNSSTSYWYNAGFGTDTAAYIDLGATHKLQPWIGSPGGFTDFGLPWSPDGTQLVILTRDEGVIVADYDGTEPYDGQLRRLGAVAACWVDWAPSGDALYGGSPDGCNGVVVIPLADPGAAFALPGSTAGVATWQFLGE
jgi:dipeptidyl aminopeptidase/acylaminoacyl peptidase